LYTFMTTAICSQGRHVGRASTRWWLGVAAIGLPLATSTPVGALTGATDAPRTPTCAAADVGIAFGSTGPDASHVNTYLVFINRSKATCTLDGYPTVRYVNAKGVAFGNPSEHKVLAHGTVTLTKGQATNSSFRESVPDVWRASRCQARHAAGLRVTLPGSSRGTVLRFPGRVCSGPTIHDWTTAPITSGPGPTPGACTAAQLRASLGPGQAAAGTTYIAIVFTNPVVYTCVVRGYPSVISGTGPGGARVGPSASDQPGAMPEVWVEPFVGRANASLGIVETGNFTPSACHARSARALWVTPPHSTHARYLAYAHSACTRLSSTHVRSVFAGSSG